MKLKNILSGIIAKEDISNLRARAKAGLRGKFIYSNICIRKQAENQWSKVLFKKMNREIRRNLYFYKNKEKGKNN